MNLSNKCCFDSRLQGPLGCLMIGLCGVKFRFSFQFSDFSDISVQFIFQVVVFSFVLILIFRLPFPPFSSITLAICRNGNLIIFVASALVRRCFVRLCCLCLFLFVFIDCCHAVSNSYQLVWCQFLFVVCVFFVG